MRKLMAVIVLVLIALAIWYFLTRPAAVDLSQPILRAGQTPLPTATPPPPPALTPTSTPAPTATPSPPPTPPPPSVDPQRLARLQEIAGRMNVQLQAVQPEQGGAWLVVGWFGDTVTPGTDYLERLMREGVIRDFDLERKQLGAQIVDGRRMFIQRQFVRF